MSPETAKVKICNKRERLSQQLLDAVSAIATLQTQQSANLISGGEGLPRVEVAIEAARKGWEGAGDAYISHIMEHEC